MLLQNQYNTQFLRKGEMRMGKEWWLEFSWSWRALKFLQHPYVVRVLTTSQNSYLHLVSCLLVLVKFKACDWSTWEPIRSQPLMGIEMSPWSERSRFDAYLIGTSIWRLPNWHEQSTLTQLARAFDAYPIGTSNQRLPNWHERSTLTQLARAFYAYPN